jgi:hypothetical protein
MTGGPNVATANEANKPDGITVPIDNILAKPPIINEAILKETFFFFFFWFFFLFFSLI